jgi:hypothetical protein
VHSFWCRIGAAYCPFLQKSDKVPTYAMSRDGVWLG